MMMNKAIDTCWYLIIFDKTNFTCAFVGFNYIGLNIPLMYGYGTY